MTERRLSSQRRAASCTASPVSALMTGWTVEQVRTWPDRSRAVSAAAGLDAARRWLDKRRSVTGYLIKDTRPEEKRS